MNKSTIIFILFLGSLNLSFSQQKEREPQNYVPNEYVNGLLNKNDSLKLVFNKTKNNLTAEEIINIFAKTKTNEYNIKQTKTALLMTSEFGDSWSFSDTISSQNALKFANFEDFLVFRNSTPTSSSASFYDDGSLKREETIYPNGTKEIIEKNGKGKYVKKTISPEGDETIEEIEDISNYNTAKIEVIRN